MLAITERGFKNNGEGGRQPLRRLCRSCPNCSKPNWLSARCDLFVARQAIAKQSAERGLSHEGCVRRTNSPPDCLLILLTPAYKDLSGFDFAASEINEASLSQLHKCEFMDGAQNVVLIGGPGTGKTHAATALGVQAVEHHRRKVRFFSTIELVNALEQEKAKLGSLPKALPSLTSVLRELIPRINS